jgi:hypothetical protein
VKFCFAKLQHIFAEGKNAKGTQQNDNENQDSDRPPPPPLFQLTKLILTTTLFLILTLASCKDSGESADSGGSISGSTIVSGAPVTYDLKYFENADNMNEAKKATDFSYFEHGKTPLSYSINEPASAKINNGKVTINLGVPKSGDNWWWRDGFFSWFIEKGIIVTPNDARVWGGEDDDLIFLTSDSKYGLVCAKDENNFALSLTYSDKDVTIKGTYTYSEGIYFYPDEETQTWNVSLKKGWNYLIMSKNEATNTITYTASTSQPSGFKWFVGEW